ncbi:unnamed protein product [Orchesella dallaii]|uniref:Uncharacterized protein n=1 Tax=Orchesella dallaii TaxID=48710 RepID=A0ABP1RCU4_9HEXA
MGRFVIVSVCVLILVFSAKSQEYNDNGVEGDYIDRNERQVATYAYEPPSKTCARAAFGNSHCGGFSSGNNGGCDTYCSQKGYPLSWCRSTFCLCHRGQDLGAECEQV